MKDHGARPGDLVEVRSAAEILETLDANGALDAKLAWKMLDQLQRAPAHRARRPQHRQPFHMFHARPYIT